MDSWDASKEGGREFVHDLVGTVAGCTILTAGLEIFATGNFSINRTVFTLGFCYLLYKKRNWARLFVSPIWGFAGIYIAYESVQVIREAETLFFVLLGGLWFVYGLGLTITSLTLLFSPNVRRYFENKQATAEFNRARSND